jgi:hypothetical protein
VVGEGFAEGVAVLLGAELSEYGEDEGAASELRAKIVEDVGVECHVLCTVYCVSATVRNILCDIQ